MVVSQDVCLLDTSNLIHMRLETGHFNFRVVFYMEINEGNRIIGAVLRLIFPGHGKNQDMGMKGLCFEWACG